MSATNGKLRPIGLAEEALGRELNFLGNQPIIFAGALGAEERASPNGSLPLHPSAVTSKLFSHSQPPTRWHDTMLHTGKYRAMIAHYTCGEGHQRRKGNTSGVDGEATLPPPIAAQMLRCHQSIQDGQMHDPIPWLRS